MNQQQSPDRQPHLPLPFYKRALHPIPARSNFSVSHVQHKRFMDHLRNVLRLTPKQSQKDYSLS